MDQYWLDRRPCPNTHAMQTGEHVQLPLLDVYKIKRMKFQPLASAMGFVDFVYACGCAIVHECM